MLKKKIKESEDYLFYFRTYSGQCFNLDPSQGKRQHNSEHIWFIVRDYDKISQRCYCECQTADKRLYGPCSKYEGSTYMLPPSISQQLKKEKLDIKELEESKSTQSFMSRYMEIVKQ